MQREFFERIASFCRLIVFDKRGTGLSDRVAGIADIETRMDDVRAVMDAAGSGIAFEDRGAAELKGVAGEWKLYAVADAAS